MLHEKEVMKIEYQIPPPPSYISLIIKLFELEERYHFCYEVNDNKSVSREWQRATSMIAVSLPTRNYAGLKEK